MYKSKIKAWGLDKKIKGNEARAIVRMRRKRSAAGKASTFRIRGQVLDFNRVKSHLKRKGLTLDDIPSVSNSPVPSLECYTPEPQVQELSCSATDNALTSWNGQFMFRTPSPRLISSPDPFRIPEQLFRDIHTYFSESFASARWVYQARWKGLVNVTCSKPPRKESLLELPWSQLILWAGHLLLTGGAANITKAGQDLQKAFIHCEDAIKAEEPDLIVDLLTVLDDLEAFYEKPEIARILLKHIHSLASVILGMKHPIVSVSRQLSFLDTWTDISGVAWNVVTDTCERFLGPGNIHTELLQVAGFTRFFGRNNFSFAETRLRDFLSKPRRPSGLESFINGMAHYQMVWVLMKQGKLDTCGAEAELLLGKNAVWVFQNSRYTREPRAANLSARTSQSLFWSLPYILTCTAKSIPGVAPLSPTPTMAISEMPRDAYR
jgi:hypothetical protein